MRQPEETPAAKRRRTGRNVEVLPEEAVAHPVEDRKTEPDEGDIFGAGDVFAVAVADD